ncbi:hypothetical protein Slash_18 [Bacillus phage Slash]|uniref:Uncharacterized protein n=1 Tax=Bacillus phage Slash TaxID=1406790 RepID=U5Q051_9CAUD|nr:hypothetical protein Slash_18 [Bacillus phage Slash]AGY48307.1 hypothetical protein Slash_18 [Bacillus phage Slash]
MDIVMIIIKILAAALAFTGAFGGTTFLIHAVRHVKENAKESEKFNHQEDMGACVEYIMYMVSSIFFYVAAVVGLLLMIALKLIN